MTASIEPQPLPIEPEPDNDGGNARLVEVIRSEVDRHGAITFARFMELALYAPGLGYYATTDIRATRVGDFLTAPELHPIFGWTVARQIHEMWRRLGEPSRFTLREYGAGTGVLGQQIRQGLERDRSPLVGALVYEPIEAAGRGGSSGSSKPFTGVVLGNEFLDALPVHRVINYEGELRELYVGRREDRFVELMGPISDDGLRERVRPQELAPQQRTEVSLAIPSWLTELMAELELGYVLLFDYGLTREEFRGPDRPNGTIRAFKANHVSSDVLGGVGRRDITASVDLDALADDARQAGFDLLGQVRQARFLMNCGLEEVYGHAKEPADTVLDSALLIRSVMRRLLDPRQLGGYSVVALGKGVNADPPLRGFA